MTTRCWSLSVAQHCSERSQRRARPCVGVGSWLRLTTPVSLADRVTTQFVVDTVVMYPKDQIPTSLV